MSEQEIYEAVKEGTLTVEEANEMILRRQPLCFTRTPRGLVQVEGLVAKRYLPAYTPMEWRRILARQDDILNGLKELGL